MISLDGVMQAPGGPQEDTSGGFEFGGWTAPFSDEAETAVVKKELAVKADYILGRKTFEIWEAYWPHRNDYWPNINSGKKYVLSATRKESSWENSFFIESVDDIIRLKNSDGPDLHVWGSSGKIYNYFCSLTHFVASSDSACVYPFASPGAI